MTQDSINMCTNILYPNEKNHQIVPLPKNISNIIYLTTIPPQNLKQSKHPSLKNIYIYIYNQ